MSPHILQQRISAMLQGAHCICLEKEGEVRVHSCAISINIFSYHGHVCLLARDGGAALRCRMQMALGWRGCLLVLATCTLGVMAPQGGVWFVPLELAALAGVCLAAQEYRLVRTYLLETVRRLHEAAAERMP